MKLLHKIYIIRLVVLNCEAGSGLLFKLQKIYLVHCYSRGLNRNKPPILFSKINVWHWKWNQTKLYASEKNELSSNCGSIYDKHTYVSLIFVDLIFLIKVSVTERLLLSNFLSKILHKFAILC
jgi:hypothetical protein